MSLPLLRRRRPVAAIEGAGTGTGTGGDSLAKRVPIGELTMPVLVEETAAAGFMRRVSLLIASSLAVLIIWASLAEVHEVSTARGMVIPDGFERVVQHFEGGIVEGILVRPGDLVSFGEPLFVLDDAATVEDLDVATRQKADIEAQIEVIMALAAARAPDYSAMEGAVATRARASHDTQKDAIAKERQLIISRIEQARAMLSSFDAQLDALADDRRFAEENFARVEGLAEKGYVTRSLLAERRKAITDAQNATRIAEEKKEGAVERLNEAQKNLASYDARTQADLATRLQELRSQLTAMTGDVSKKTRRRARLTVTSPVKGLVKSLDVTTIGGVVARGQTLATIVPLGEELLAETQIPVSEIGYIHVGLPAHVKVSAFDFTQFGWIEGEVSEISPSSFADGMQEPYYKVRIRLATDHLPQAPSARLSPGMAVDADIITGERTVLSYILSPISRAMKNAFVER